MLAQAQQQRIGLLQPQGAERRAAHVAYRVLPPVGVGVHFAGVVDIGDGAARGIADPGAQHLLQLRVVLG
ncbi:hypothetical protein D9M71_568770 [compost metagenome]